MPLTYSDYLQLHTLLSLQRPQAQPPASDELLFIVMHQTYELWFKQMLWDLDRVQSALAAGQIPEALDGLKRVRAIFGTLLTQLDVLNTMTAASFCEFRGALGTSSGFQSAQFRAIEFLFGFKNDAALARYLEHSPERLLLERYYRRPTLWDSLLGCLHRLGHEMPAVILDRDVCQPAQPSGDVQRILIGVYRTDPGSAHLLEYFLDVDTDLQKWRWSHKKVAERMIGNRYGTGSTAGVRYLERTLSPPAFPDLWEIRNCF